MYFCQALYVMLGIKLTDSDVDDIKTSCQIIPGKRIKQIHGLAPKVVMLINK